MCLLGSDPTDPEDPRLLCKLHCLSQSTGVPQPGADGVPQPGRVAEDALKQLRLAKWLTLGEIRKGRLRTFTVGIDTDSLNMTFLQKGPKL